MTPAWSVTQSRHYILVRDSCKSNSHMTFLSNFTSDWPQLTPCKTFDTINALHQIWWPRHFKGIWPLVDPGWPLHVFWPQQWVTIWSRVLPTKFSGHTSFLSHLTSGWPRLTPAWPLTPAIRYTLVRDFSTKFSGHKALLSKLTPTWPQLTPTWPSTPVMHYTMVRGSSHHIWWP